MPVSGIVYALMDAARSGVTWSHLLTIAVFTLFIAVFVVPLALARRRNRS